MKQSVRWATVAIVLSFGSAASAEQDGPPLSLRGALQEALANNLELPALRRQVDATRFKPAQQRFLAPPMLEAQIWQWPLNTLNPLNTNMYMFMATQELPGRGKRALRVAAAEKEVARAEVDVAVRARQIVEDVKRQYADLLIARKAAEISLASLELLRELTDVSEVKYAAGRISQNDVLKGVVELSKLHGDLIRFQQQADLARVRLNLLMNRPPESPIGAVDVSVEQVLVTSVADLQRRALEHQPEIQMARVQVEQAEAQLALARSDSKPDFSVQGGYMLMPHQTDAWMGRLGITWPRAPWSRSRTDARVAEASAEVETAKARRNVAENTVRLAVADAYIRVKAAEQQAALLRTTILPQSRQTLDVSRVAYESDRVDFLALIDNERTLLAAELEYARTLSDHVQAAADLERALGRELDATQLSPVIAVEVR